MTVEITDRQREIIEASGKILMNKGIKGLTTKNLAMEMGFSESAIYRHFSNKEEILESLFKSILENFRERLDKILLLDLSPEKKLMAIFESQSIFFANNPHFTIAVLADDIYYEGENVKNSLLQIMSYKSGVITTILESGIETGNFRNDVEIAQLQHTIVGSFRLLLHKWRLSNFEFDLQIAVNQMMNALTILLQQEYKR